MSTQICKKCRVTGRVQGVFFRDSTRTMALSLGIYGSAINLRDGSVEVVACGAETEVDELCQWLWHGSDMSHVESVQCEVVNAKAVDQQQIFIIG